MLSPVQSSSGTEFARHTKALLEADLAGGRTTLRRQRVGYPLHVTRGFYLDSEKPDLLTLYLQSASGGLYAGDDLTIDVTVRQGAALNITTQAATVVHHGRDAGSVQRQNVLVESGAFCAFTSDPYVLFPGAGLQLVTEATVADDGICLLIDGFSIHDPHDRRGRFTSFETNLEITRPDGQLVFADRGQICGSDLQSKGGPLGGMLAAATLVLVAPARQCPDLEDLESRVGRTGCLTGASLAPNGGGVMVRMLAPDGGALARGLEVAFHAAAQAALGLNLARRRK